jgi:hypothetical protein
VGCDNLRTLKPYSIRHSFKAVLLVAFVAVAAHAQALKPVAVMGIPTEIVPVEARIQGASNAPGSYQQFLETASRNAAALAVATIQEFVKELR